MLWLPSIHQLRTSATSGATAAKTTNGATRDPIHASVGPSERMGSEVRGVACSDINTVVESRTQSLILSCAMLSIYPGNRDEKCFNCCVDNR